MYSGSLQGTNPALGQLGALRAQSFKDQDHENSQHSNDGRNNAGQHFFLHWRKTHGPQKSRYRQIISTKALSPEASLALKARRRRPESGCKWPEKISIAERLRLTAHLIAFTRVWMHAKARTNLAIWNALQTPT
jgi:hypothetical protein